MDKNKVALTASVFATGITGVLVGALLVSKPVNSIKSFANQDTKQVTTASSNKFDNIQGLSKAFIDVSKQVTPEIVSIYSTKVVKQKNNYNEYLDDPFFKKFFDVPEHKDQGKNKDRKEQGLGSGIIVDSSGLILTNNHVVEGASEIKVTLSDKRKFKAKIIGTDPKSDVAVIKLEKADNLPVAKLGDSTKMEIGEFVLAIGNPLGLTSTVTSGIISAKGRADVGVADFEDFIQTDAAINPGNSGGALVNLNGEVIGINTAIASRTGGYMGVGFAIPINMAKKIMNDIVTKGKVTRGFLGIQIQNMTESMAKGLKVENPNSGIVVGDIFKGSPADKAGIKRYDVILELNGKEVTDVSAFRNTIAASNPGEKQILTVLRDGKKVKVEIKLGELENKEKKTTESVKDDENTPEKIAPDKKLGIEIEPISKDTLKELGINKEVKGVIVSDINETSNASEGGLMKGDIIQEINRIRIDDIADFNKAVKPIKEGDSVLMKVLRGNNIMLLAFTHQ
ncbi:MAG: DegQ family serine endoprotease [Candidatus Sericytochromatia bacterium]